MICKVKVAKIKKETKSVKYLTFGLKKQKFYTHSCGKHKRKYRFIDFFRIYSKIPAYVLKLEYDPNRSAMIALLCYKNGMLSYIIAPCGLKVNTYISAKLMVPGYVNSLHMFRFGSFIHCVELIQQYGGKVARSAGCYCILLTQYDIDVTKFIIRLPSGENRLVDKFCKAALGIVSNVHLKDKKLCKAGNNIWRGKKPHVRGVAKNAVDHPHGGGRGKTSKLAVSSNFTRRVLSWVKTRRFKKNSYILRERS